MNDPKSHLREKMSQLQIDITRTGTCATREAKKIIDKFERQRTLTTLDSLQRRAYDEAYTPDHVQVRMNTAMGLHEGTGQVGKDIVGTVLTPSQWLGRDGGIATSAYHAGQAGFADRSSARAIAEFSATMDQDTDNWTPVQLPEGLEESVSQLVTCARRVVIQVAIQTELGEIRTMGPPPGVSNVWEHDRICTNEL